MIRVKKLRRRCNVRGCKSLDTYSISHAREAGNTIIVCKDCLREALAAIEALEAPAIPENTAPDTAAEPEVNEEAAVVDNEPSDDAETDGEPYVCAECGKSFASEKGLKAHSKTHKESLK